MVRLEVPTEEQCEAQYHCGIDELLSTAYQRDFTKLEMGEVQDQVPDLQGMVCNPESRTAATGRPVACKEFSGMAGIKKPTQMSTSA